VVVEADVFADGHDAIAAVLRFKAEGETEWREVEMRAIGNDRWRAAFLIERLGKYFFTIEAWVDHFRSWARDFDTKLAAKQESESRNAQWRRVGARGRRIREGRGSRGARALGQRTWCDRER
jgi:starch synthase (maltosyl-transferring)